jgi:hypothetical protein
MVSEISVHHGREGMAPIMAARKLGAGGRRGREDGREKE